MVSMAVPNQIPMLQSCSSHMFEYPPIFGAEFTGLQASLVTNYSSEIPATSYYGPFSRATPQTAFCNVTVTYTHPGQNDSINVNLWLPTDNWNQRLQGVGGGGYQTGMFPYSREAAINEGYAMTTTDGGHILDAVEDPASWALTSPGNVNLYALQNFASVCLNEAALIGKHITEQFYGMAPKYSYWNGCSTGGRQGLMLAQRYPDAYDGILANAPAISWPSFLVAEYWPQLIMNELQAYPNGCELNAITAAAIAHCDEQDGVKDGIVSLPEICDFDPYTLIGTNTPPCSDVDDHRSLVVSKAAAAVAQAAWTGAVKPDGTLLWPGLSPDAVLSGPFHLASTVCDSTTGSDCRSLPFPISLSWIKLFVQRGDPSFDETKLTRSTFTNLLHHSAALFNSTIASANPDLSEFKSNGGKMITWHGLADPVIFPNGSRNYYEDVKAGDTDVQDYYRYFEAPGVYHCAGGPGALPGKALEALVNWVEKGEAPDTLEAVSLPDEDGEVWERDLCMYPLKATYKGSGNVRSRGSWECI